MVEIIPAHELPPNVPALSTQWEKGRLGSRGKSPKAVLRSLSLIQQFRPLVINRLLKAKVEFDSLLADALGISRRKYVEAFLDYAPAYAQGHEAAVRGHLLAQVLPEDFLNEMSDELFDFAARGDSVSAANATLTGAIAFADEGRIMPRIEGIQLELLLRKDPHLKAVREQLKLFHSGLLVGDRNAVLEARREIQMARRRPERRSGWDRALRWLTYVSVPMGTAES